MTDYREIIRLNHRGVSGSGGQARLGVSSTIFCSQYTPEGWHAKIGEGVVADAILDRVVHNAHMIRIQGKESMRKKKGIATTA